jgi:alkylation response protein AidB-like acyl-CoA dehydrogenase
VDFSWTDEQVAFRREVIRFAQQELNDNIIDRDHCEQFSRELWNRCGKFGIQGLPVPQEYGGTGADALTIACALEALGFGCRDNGLLFSINAHMWTAEIPIINFGSESQKLRYLPKLASGEWIGGNAMTEPMSGSDAYSLRTRAQRKNGCYVLNGSKTFITNAECADVLVVFANVDPGKGRNGVSAFLVEKNTPGLNISKKLHKMGLRTSPMSELAFVDCTIPADNVLGHEGSGQAVFTSSMEWERSCILASHLGAMQRILDICVRYASDREQFGQPIAKFHPISNTIAEMDLRLETARLILYKAAWLKSQGKHPHREASMAKLYVSETYIKACLDAIQLHGGYGYVTDYQLERELRDSIGGTIYSGTSEIQKMIISGLHGV